MKLTRRFNTRDEERAVIDTALTALILRSYNTLSVNKIERLLKPQITPSTDSFLSVSAPSAQIMIGIFMLNLLSGTDTTCVILLYAETPEDALAEERAKNSRLEMSNRLGGNRTVPLIRSTVTCAVTGYCLLRRVESGNDTTQTSTDPNAAKIGFGYKGLCTNFNFNENDANTRRSTKHQIIDCFFSLTGQVGVLYPNPELGATDAWELLVNNIGKTTLSSLSLPIEPTTNYFARNTTHIISNFEPPLAWDQNQLITTRSFAYPISSTSLTLPSPYGSTTKLYEGRNDTGHLENQIPSPYDSTIKLFGTSINLTISNAYNILRDFFNGKTRIFLNLARPIINPEDCIYYCWIPKPALVGKDSFWYPEALSKYNYQERFFDRESAAWKSEFNLSTVQGIPQVFPTSNSANSCLINKLDAEWLCIGFAISNITQDHINIFNIETQDDVISIRKVGDQIQIIFDHHSGTFFCNLNATPPFCFVISMSSLSNKVSFINLRTNRETRINLGAPKFTTKTIKAICTIVPQASYGPICIFCAPRAASLPYSTSLISGTPLDSWYSFLFPYTSLFKINTKGALENWINPVFLTPSYPIWQNSKEITFNFQKNGQYGNIEIIITDNEETDAGNPKAEFHVANTFKTDFSNLPTSKHKGNQYICLQHSNSEKKIRIQGTFEHFLNYSALPSPSLSEYQDCSLIITIKHLTTIPNIGYPFILDSFGLINVDNFDSSCPILFTESVTSIEEIRRQASLFSNMYLYSLLTNNTGGSLTLHPKPTKRAKRATKN